MHLVTWGCDALFHRIENGQCFFFGDWLRTNALATQKAGHFRRGFYNLPGGVGHVHFRQHIAREEFTFGGGFFTATHFHNILRGHHHLLERFREALLSSGFQNGLRHFLLEARMGMNNIPALGFTGGHGCDNGFRSDFFVIGDSFVH